MKPDLRCRFRLLIPFFVAAVLAVLTLIVRSLWNGVLVDVVAVKTITYWQALGLLLLARILFGGWPGGRRGFGRRARERMMTERWESLDPEKRARMREEMRRRFGDWPRPPWCGPEDRAPGMPAKPGAGPTPE